MQHSSARELNLILGSRWKGRFSMKANFCACDGGDIQLPLFFRPYAGQAVVCSSGRIRRFVLARSTSYEPAIEMRCWAWKTNLEFSKSARLIPSARSAEAQETVLSKYSFSPISQSCKYCASIAYDDNQNGLSSQ